MIPVSIDGIRFNVKSNTSILETCKTVGITIPRFCYHETLSVVGNCRMCLIEMEGIEKPVASCVTEVSPNISIHTNSIFVRKARENVLEALLVNHPLDCPICDQAGECDLQDQTKAFGSISRRFFFKKRGVEDKDCGPFIKTIMTRCIHCTRCVRFGSEITGLDILGTLNRGSSSEIGAYVPTFIDSEISGNVIDLCPVGALTSRPYSFNGRPWELRVNESFDTSDSTCSNIYVNSKDFVVARILPRNNDSINQNLISDKIRFCYDSNEVNRIKSIRANFDETDPYSMVYRKWQDFIRQRNYKKNRKLRKGKAPIWGRYVQNPFVVDESIGFTSLQKTKQQENISKISLASLNSNLTHSNFYTSNLNGKISNIDSCNDICFFLSLNPKIECSVLNARLKTKFRNSLMGIFSLNMYFPYNNPITYLNLNLDRSLNVFEGRFTNLSKDFVVSTSPLVLLSDSLNKRLNSFNLDFIIYLKSVFDTIVNLKINSSSNKESLDYLNIKNLTYNKIKNTSSVLKTFCFNMDDVYSFYKYYVKDTSAGKEEDTFIKKLYRFSSHHNELFDLTQLKETFFPTLSEFEDEAIHVNLEGRPQKTTSCFPQHYNSRNISTVIDNIFENKIKLHSYSNFLNEMVKEPSFFDKIQSQFSNVCFRSSFYLRYKDILVNYPTKVNMQDPYLSNRITKHSIILLESSILVRQKSFTF